ncbi:MAG TPA: metallophosphoesterase [Polyangiaceae bacterium]|nr:metallophosphoesterase [Polyangiaceae bacterium]
MATIAQLSDLHLVEDHYDARPLSTRARLSCLSLGRPLEPRVRKERVARALAEVRSHGADHLVITGDLTEDGAPAQFEVLAEVLADSRIPPERITLVPGNHDAYDAADNYAAALAGPLRLYAPTSTIGAPLPFRDVTLVPVSTAFHQSPLRSAGAIASAELEALQRTVNDAAFRGRPLVLVQHHPPGRHCLPPFQWFDGLLEHSVLSAMTEQSSHLHVVHGHTHRAVNRAVRKGEAARIFSALAVVESENALRLYDASPAGLTPLAADLVDGIGALVALA